MLFGFAWWAPPVLAGAWLSTHWLLRESGVWKDRNTEEVRQAQRDAEYAYRLAVDPPAAKELRLFGLADWVLDRFVTSRRRLHQLQYEATRLRERSVLVSLLIVLAANVLVFWLLASAALGHHLSLGGLVVYAQAAVGTSMIAFGGLNWALDGAAAPVAAVAGSRRPWAGPARSRRVRGRRTGCRPGRSASATSRSPIRQRPTARCCGDSTWRSRRARSLAIVGQNGAGKTTLAKLLCRLYDPQSGAIEVDGVDLRELDLASWRRRVTAVFQDFIRFELPLRDNVMPRSAGAAVDASANPADVDAVLAEALDVGRRERPGGLRHGAREGLRRRHRPVRRPVAARRARAGAGAVRLGAGLVLLDEPTAQLDVRGEAEIFERVLAATRSCTTILISHRFSTVRQADRICVLEHGACRRARQPRRADGAARPVLDDVRAAGAAVRDRHAEEARKR